MDVFSHHPDRFKVTIICGKNKVLYRKLSRQTPQHITVYGYVTNMAELIYQADAVITKPGGLTVTEALFMQNPLVSPATLARSRREQQELFATTWVMLDS